MIKTRDGSFWLAIFIIALTYFSFEYFYVNFAGFVVDEFVFARQIYEYTFAVPYRDFMPYKGVLGNYLLTPAFFLSNEMTAPLYYIKSQIVVMNTFCIIVAAYWARKFFNDKAIIISLIAVLVNYQMLLLSSDLRVDMLSSWLCLFASLAIIGLRPRLAGTLIALAFLVSQKALWYLAAIEGALFFCWITVPNTQYNLRTFFQFNVFAGAIVALYVIFWSSIATPAAVFQSLFYEAYTQAAITNYLPIYFTCWEIALIHGPILFLCLPLTFSPLFAHMQTRLKERHILIIALCSLALLQFSLYMQIFPYNFVYVTPALFLLYSNYLGWLFDNKKNCARLIWIIVFAGIVYPITYTLMIYDYYNKNYQQGILRLVTELTRDGSDYLAGTPLLYKKDQPVKGLKNLIELQIEYFYMPTPKLARGLISSLYLAKTSIPEVLNEIEHFPIKVIVRNMRFNALPAPILHYLYENYAPYYASVYIYSPTIAPDKKSFSLKFSGNYRLESQNTLVAQIDGRFIKTKEVVFLKSGAHTSSAKFSYRLSLVPDVKEKLDPNMKEEPLVKAVMH